MTDSSAPKGTSSLKTQIEKREVDVKLFFQSDVQLVQIPHSDIYTKSKGIGL